MLGSFWNLICNKKWEGHRKQKLLMRVMNAEAPYEGHKITDEVRLDYLKMLPNDSHHRRSMIERHKLFRQHNMQFLHKATKSGQIHVNRFTVKELRNYETIYVNLRPWKKAIVKLHEDDRISFF